MVSRLIKKIVFIIEILLFLRLLTKFSNANPETPIVSLIYKCTNIIVWPFRLIFPDIYWQNHLVEITTIIAMIGYAIAVFIIFQVIQLFHPGEGSRVRNSQFPE